MVSLVVASIFLKLSRNPSKRCIQLLHPCFASEDCLNFKLCFWTAGTSILGLKITLFLHESQLFPVLRRIMAQNAVDPDEQKAEKRVIFQCTTAELESDFKVSVSSGANRADNMKDGTTETYWQSALNADQEDYNRQHGDHFFVLEFADPTDVSEIGWYLDCERDQEYLPASVELYVELSSSIDKFEMKQSHQIPSDVTGFYNFPLKASSCKKVKILIKSVHNGNYEVRVRAIKLYSHQDSSLLEEMSKSKVEEQLQIQAFQLFQKLVKVLFSGLILNTDKGDESSDPTPPSVPELTRQGSSTELQQQVVGLLFGEKSRLNPGELSDLQRLVFELIFAELQKEISILGENKKLVRVSDGEFKLEEHQVPDNYVFELSSLVASLSTSGHGRKFISSPLLCEVLLCLFIPGTPRIQRTLIRIFGRVLPVTSPDNFSTIRIQMQSWKVCSSLIEFFLCCIASGLSVGYRGSDKKQISALTMKRWDVRFESGEVKALAKLIRTLFFAPKWNKAISSIITRSLLDSSHLLQSEVESGSREDLWILLSSLAVIGGDMNDEPLTEKWNFELPKNVVLDSGDGSTKVKVLAPNGQPKCIVVGDLIQCKAMVEFRQVLEKEQRSCRFCGTLLHDANLAPGSPSESLAIVCNSAPCLELRDLSCIKTLKCGHFCNGVKGEEECLPCLHSDCDQFSPDCKQDGDDLCNICWTENLYSQPSLLLKCGHIFHSGCARQLLQNRWNGPRITFGFRNCPLCKTAMSHPALKDLTDPIDVLYREVADKALVRLKYEHLEEHPDITVKGGNFFGDPLGFAMHKFAYYLCFKCGKPYYGGDYECAAAGAADFDPSELLCGSCSPILSEECPKHGKDFLEFKCRYCCSVAIWFCFGTTHFCEPCHNLHYELTQKPKDQLVPCPCRPKSNNSLPEPLDQTTCPLGISHPPHGEEFALGCGLCRNVKSF
eukprot:TRINITY_DN6722_c0_g3_i1.p1 TRINITY_DN6722_c0_g3~~TRINITY_DN6722_c0_g3_i1.p1  ORF type:complete len:948 (+),score=190.30 TRINITY_DN6722_c0_g3_i1:135-2978(+)